MGHSIWPLILLICSNLVYQTCAKSSSKDASPFAILTIAYTIAALGSVVMYLIAEKGTGSVMANIRAMNWANYVLGLAIIGLEGGFIALYRAGWSVSVGPICSYTGVAIGLMFLGFLFFHEHITLKQVLGTFLCLGGIFLIINKS